MNFNPNRFGRGTAAPMQQRPAAPRQALRPFGAQPQALRRPLQALPAQTLQRPPMQQRAQMMPRPAAPPPRPRMAAPMQRPPMGALPPKPPMTQPRQPGGMGGGMGGAAMMSDQRSKERIRELEDLNETYRALMPPERQETLHDLEVAGILGTDFRGEDDHHAFGTPIRPDAPYPKSRAPDTKALDRAHGEQFKPIGSYTWEYKNPERHGEGRYTGGMAHQMKRIPGVVKETPEGDAIDTGRLSLATASVVGEQQRELDDLKSNYEALLDEDIEYPKPRRPAL